MSQQRAEGAYPPVNTQPANVRVDGLPASMPATICPGCGRQLGHTRMGWWDICAMCKTNDQRASRARARERRYQQELATWEGEGGALPPDNPSLTLAQRGLKRCTSCGADLPLGWFRLNGKGRRSRCRHCERPQKSRDHAIRRARLASQVEEVPNDFIRRLMVEQHGLCACGCGRSIMWEYHVDHRIPLARGGVHRFSNLQLLSPKCNLKKGAKV